MDKRIIETVSRRSLAFERATASRFRQFLKCEQDVIRHSPAILIINDEYCQHFGPVLTLNSLKIHLPSAVSASGADYLS